MLQSSNEHREIALMHQLACMDQQGVREAVHG
jgi:hypothetical protein